MAVIARSKPGLICLVLAMALGGVAVAAPAEDASSTEAAAHEGTPRHVVHQAAPGEPFPAATPEAVVAVTREIFPAVVRLDVAQEVYSEGKRNLRRGIGSGVIFDPQG